MLGSIPARSSSLQYTAVHIQSCGSGPKIESCNPNKRPAAMLGSIPVCSSSLQLISGSDTVLRIRTQNRVLQSVQEAGRHAGQHTCPFFIPAIHSGSDMSCGSGPKIESCNPYKRPAAMLGRIPARSSSRKAQRFRYSPADHDPK
jgi:hypothetical protein